MGRRHREPVHIRGGDGGSRDQFGRGALAIGQVGLADLLANRHDNPLPAHHRAKTEGDCHRNLHPQGNKLGRSVERLLVIVEGGNLGRREATSPHSDNYEIYNGATLLYRWTGEVYTGVGPNFYGITNAPTAVPADTTITGIIYTFPTSTNPPAPYNASEYSYRSEVQWNCTTGALISITNSGGGPVASVVAVPALGPEALAALALLLLVAGAWLVRRRT